MPDGLFELVRKVMAERGITLRELVIDSLERALCAEPQPFILRDAAAGYQAEPGKAVSSDAINAAIDAQREQRWHG